MEIGLINSKTKESWLLFFGNSVLIGLNFLIFSVFSHQLSLVDYGALRELLFYVNFILVLGSSGISQAIYYFLNKYNQLNNQLLIIKQFRFLQLLILAVLIPIFLIFYYLDLSSTLNLASYIYLFIYISFSLVTIIDLNISLIYKKFPLFIFFNSLIIIVKFVIIFLFASKLTLNQILLVLSLFQFLLFAINYLIFVKIYFGFGKVSLMDKGFIEIKKYLFPLTIGLIFSFLIGGTDKFLISFFKSSPEQFAILSNVSFEIPFLSNLYLSFFTISFPLMVKAYQENDINKLLKNRFNYIKNISHFVFVIIIGVMVWHKEIFGLIFGQKYVNYSYLFAIYSSTGLLRFCSHHDVLLTTGKTNKIMKYQIIELIIHFIISAILFYFFQLTGLVVATVITCYLYIFLINIQNAKILKTSLLHILPYKFLLKNLFFNTAIALGIYYFSSYYLNMNMLLVFGIWLTASLLFGLKFRNNST